MTPTPVSWRRPERLHPLSNTAIPVAPVLYESTCIFEDCVFVPFKVLLQQVDMVDLSIAHYFHLVGHPVDNYMKSSPLQSKLAVLCGQEH